MSFTVPQAELGTLEEIASGKFARVYRIPEYRVEGEPFTLVLKKYRKSVQVPVQSLEQIVAVREQMQPEQRSRLDARTAWPLRVVEGDGRAAGVLMRLIPDDLFQTVRLRRSHERRPREVQYALQDKAFCTRTGLSFLTTSQRLGILIDLAYILALLHKANVVYGDISTRNVIYALTPKPRVMLVDCDAVRVKGTAAIFGKQPHSPDWEPPEALLALSRVATQRTRSQLTLAKNAWAVQSRETDVYKFALAVIRVMSPVPKGSIQRTPAKMVVSLPPAVERCLSESLSTNPRARPSMKDWYETLTRKPGESQSQPVVPGQHGTLRDRPRRTRGRWQEQADGSWIRAK